MNKRIGRRQLKEKIRALNANVADQAKEKNMTPGVKIYVVRHNELGGYIGHGLYDTYTVIDGVYATREDAEMAVENDKSHDYWIKEEEVKTS